MKPTWQSKIILVCALAILGALADGLANGLSWRHLAAGIVFAVIAALRQWATWTTLTGSGLPQPPEPGTGAPPPDVTP